TSGLRIIISSRKPGKMPSYHAIVRGGYAMIPHQFFYLMVVWALLCLFFMLQVACPSQGGVTLQRPGEPEPIKPRRTRSKEPPLFVGLTQKPPCALVEHEASHPM